MANSKISRNRAFTIVEIMIVVTIIGFLVMMARPTIMRVVTQARASALINDFRVFSAAFAQYASVNGTFPDSYTTKGGFPAVMDGRINPTQWARVTPIGGNYGFLKDNKVAGQKYRALIRVQGTGKQAISFSPEQLLAFDKRFDDGVLTTGRIFVNGTALNTFYVVEK